MATSDTTSKVAFAEHQQGEKEDLNDLKFTLVNVVSASLIKEPRFNDANDKTVPVLVPLLEKVAARDPEFILKLALYVRDDLNIRSTANFMLALAANIDACTPFIKKYYKAIVRLPSDWLDIAALCMMLPNRNLQGKALPTSLRKAMIHKFPEFDAYQLGKYNKEGKLKRKAKKAKEAAAKTKKPGKANQAEATEEGEEGDESGLRKVKVNPNQKKDLTIKQMIRQLHINKPVGPVMAILGKKYPLNSEQFRDSGLSGEFEEDRAGKRMKLPTPETWETMVSAKGNKASTWEELIDHRKLPFMAMLRNLRNMILSGISPKHHRWVISRLTDEKTVANSRQFPFSFFSAYEAINIDLKKLQEELKEAEAEKASGVKKPKKAAKTKEKKAKGAKGEKSEETRRKKKLLIPTHMPDQALLDRYRDALDTAVKIATVHNVKPIRGNTAVFCSVDSRMDNACKSARGMGSIKKLSEVGTLLGLMCKYMSEECDFYVYSSTSVAIELAEGTILQNMRKVFEKVQSSGLSNVAQSNFPNEYLERLIKERKKIDHLVVLDVRFFSPSDPKTAEFITLLRKYRQEVNPDLLFVNVNLSGENAIKAPEASEKHPNDVYIAGFSDAILRFIAERGDGNQIQYIQHIDTVKGLAGEHINKNRLAKRKKKEEEATSKVWSFLNAEQVCKYEGCGQKMKKEKLDAHMRQCSFRPVRCSHEGCGKMIAFNQVTQHQSRCLFQKLTQARSGKWRTARIFISSTFLDMHGERDILARVVFPELRERCRHRRVKLVEIDLRWGITQEESEKESSIEICLGEVDRCRPFFVGLLGERYGWVPPRYVVPSSNNSGGDETDEQFEWLKTYPPRRSVTELEIHYGALNAPVATNAMIYLRDPNFSQQVPQQWADRFKSENPEAERNVRELRERVRSSDTCGFREYSATWGGVVDGKPVASRLDDFAALVTEDLWNAICRVFPEETTIRTELDIERDYHHTFLESRAARFVGREDLLSKLFEFADSSATGPLYVHGKTGTGKSALLGFFASEYSRARPGVSIISHFIGASPGSTNIVHTLSRICRELAHHCQLPHQTIPNEYKELRQVFMNLADQAAFGRPVILIIDALNQLNETNNAQSLEWLPSNLPVKVIVSCYSEGNAYEALRLRSPKLSEIVVGPLELKARQQLVRESLWEFRKKLDETPTNNQMRILMGKPESSKPLYLVLACEELRFFGLFEKLSQNLRSMGGTVPALLNEILERLEKDHTKELVKTSMSLLACSRSGLLESEMLPMLARPVMKETTLPRGVWARLYRGLEMFLHKPSESGESYLGFFHQQMNKAVKKRYLSLKDAEPNTHKLLANYFLKKADPRGDGSFETDDVHAVSELPHHLISAKMWNQIESTLCNLKFIETKCRMGMTFDLVGDLFNATQLPWPYGSDAKLRRLDDYRRFVSGSAYILSNLPSLTHQQAANQPDSSVVSQSAYSLWNEGYTVRNAWFMWQNKSQQHDPCLLTLAGYSEPMLACAFSPDGDRMVCASKDRTLKICDAKSGAEIATLSGHTNSVVGCAFSPDGRLVASASWDCTLKLWDASVGTEIFTLTGHTKRVNYCTFSQDGRVLASASWDCSVRLWDVNTGQEIKKLSKQGHTKPVNACGFSPDDSRLVSASWDRTVIVWNVETGSPELTLSGHANSVRSVAFSPSGKQIVSTSVDCTIRVWDSRTGAVLNTISGHSKPINTCAFSADGKHLVSASDDSTIKVWDALGGREINTLSSSSMDSGWVFSAKFSPDESKIVSASSDCTLTIWNARNGTQLRNFAAHTRTVNCCEFSPVDDIIASVADDSLAKIWDAKDGKELATLEGHLDGVNCCGFSPDGTKLATGSEDFTAIVWTVSPRHVLTKTPKTSQVLRGHTGGVRSVAFTADGRRLATGSRDSTIRVWNLATGACEKILQGHMDWVTGLHFSADGQKLVSCSWDFNLKIWDIRSGREITTLRGHEGAISGCSFSPDGRRVVSSSFDQTLKIWDVAESSVITSLNGHSQRINSCQFSPSGTKIVSGSDDGTVKLWDAVAGKEITALQGHSDTVKSCAFSPATQQIVSVSEDATVKVWDVSSHSDVVGHADAVTGTAVSANGTMAASCSRDKTLSVWRMDHQQTYSKITNLISMPVSTSSTVNECDLSPDRTMVAACSDDGSIFVWTIDLVTSSLNRHSTFSSNKAVQSLAFSPTGKHLVSGGWDGNVSLWDLTTKRSNNIGAHEDWINCVRYSPDCKLVVSASHDKTVRLWDATTARKTGEFKGHENWVLSSAFSPDGQGIVSASYDQTVRVWDARSSNSGAVAVLKGHTKRVNACSYAVDGKQVLTASHDGTVHLWDLRSATSKSQLATFFCKAPVLSLATSPSSILCGDSLGNCYFLKVVA